MGLIGLSAICDSVPAGETCPACGQPAIESIAPLSGVAYRVCPIGHQWSIGGPPADPIDHPPHYCQGEIECIDAIAAATRGLDGIEAVCVGNIIRYLWRLRRKNTPAENAEKAQWYLQRLITVMGAEKNPPGGG